VKFFAQCFGAVHSVFQPWIPDSTVPFMRWQCGRVVVEDVQLSDGQPIEVERFELLARASTADGLIDKHNVHGT